MLFLPAVLFILLGITGKKAESITELVRPAAGEKEEDVSFTVKPGGMEKWLYEGKIAPRIYSAKELDELIDKAKSYIDDNLFYEGESAAGVITGVNLISKAPDGPVKIKWEGDGLTLFDSDGLITESGASDTEVHVLTAKLSCQDYICYYDIPFVTAKRIESAEEASLKKIKDAIEEKLLSGEPGEKLTLPESVDNVSLTYEVKKKDSFLPLGILFLFIPAIYVAKIKEDEKKSVKDRELELKQAYSDFVGKFVILLGAGMNVYNIFGRLTAEYEQRLEKTGKKESLYEEVSITYGELKSGVYEKVAFENFGKRIGLLSYVRFAGVLTQNLKEGAAGIIKRFEEEQINALKERKALATQLGERLETKILMPMMLELLVVLMIIMVPAFMSM